MTCPVCNSKTKTIETQPQEDCVCRRRECLECHYRFTTIELDLDFYKRMVKK